jgi:hypothetical protein
MYKIARLVTSSRVAGWVAAAVVMLNPNLLYMQSTAMSEPTSITAFIVALYYALKVMRTNRAADLTKCAAAVAAGTLIRYENWVFASAFVPIIAYAGWRHRGHVLARAWTILYALLAFAGCIAWVIYNAVIFHDPLLSFFYGQSSHSYYANTPDRLIPARHHLLLAAKMYVFTVAGTVGWVLVALALLGLGLFVWRFRLRIPTLPVYVALIPFGFYCFVLYRGVNTEQVPGFGQGPPYNVRFGLLMIPATALFLAVLVAAFPPVIRRLLVVIVLVAIVASSLAEFHQTPLDLREALSGPAGFSRADVRQAQWLDANLHGGPILITYLNSDSVIYYLMTKYGIPDHAFITDANGSQFHQALASPQTNVNWIVMNSDASYGASRIWTALHGRTDWRSDFVLCRSFGTTQYYERLVVPDPPANTPEQKLKNYMNDNSESHIEQILRRYSACMAH